MFHCRWGGDCHQFVALGILSMLTKILPFLSFLILKGTDPSIPTMAMFRANGQSLHKALSSTVHFINTNRSNKKSEENRSC